MDQPLAATLLKILSAMDAGSLSFLVALVTLTPMGLVLLIVVFWLIEDRRRRADLSRYQKDMDRILKAYGDDLRVVTGYYKDNVKLVEAYQSLATSLHDQVVLNTQVMQRLVDSICSNQFCPAARIAKGESPMKGGF
ncbi:hypothetical protein [Solidesulfovibrio sp.]|uniref:hypothetical protein n=1 Tax=Solidesulfovibrio sp. TaxID=2910990 RepID=UPI00262F842B|nr:hypothetical protein [Solidesulfovibrio sp.]